MVKIQTKVESIKLRALGYSYSYISAHLGVSKSTLSVWLADVPYVPNIETITKIGKARAASIEAKQKIKRASIRSAKEQAIGEIGALTKRDGFMLGLGLYIGEGAKSTEQIRFVNSNPDIVCSGIRWFTQILGARRSQIKIRLHLYPDTDESTSLEFWSKKTAIPRGQFLKSQIDRRTNKKKMNSGKLPYGTAHVSVLSLGDERFGVFLARKIAAWSNFVLRENNAGLV